jgi:hypothetical protein
LRSSPGTRILAKVLVKVLETFQWYHFAFVHDDRQGPNDCATELIDVANSVMLRRPIDVELLRIKQYPDTLVNSKAFEDDVQQEVIEFLKKKEHRAIGVQLPAKQMHKLMELFAREGLKDPDHVLFTMWYSRTNLPKMFLNDYKGSLSLQISADGENGASQRFQNAWQSMTHSNLTVLDLPITVYHQLNRALTKIKTSNTPFEWQDTTRWFDSIMASVFAYKKAFEALKSGFPANPEVRGDELKKAMYAVHFEGTSGDVHFTHLDLSKGPFGGDRSFNRFHVLQVQEKGFVKVLKLQSLGMSYSHVTIEYTSEDLVFPNGKKDPKHYDWPRDGKTNKQMNAETLIVAFGNMSAAKRTQLVVFGILLIMAPFVIFAFAYWLWTAKSRKHLRALKDSECLGVSLEYLINFFPAEAREATGKDDPTFHEIAPVLFYGPGTISKDKVCPRDDKKGCSFVDALPNKRRGKANRFLSWCWAYKLSTFVGALQTVADEAKDDQTGTGSIYIWVCAFCNNQYRILDQKSSQGADDLEHIFESRLQQISHVIVMLDHFVDPFYVRRVWCVYETFTAKRLGIEIQFALPPSEDRLFVEKIMAGECTSVAHSLSHIDVENATASIKEDEIMVKGKIRSTVGFQAVNATVKDSLIDWCGKRFMTLMDEFPETRVPSSSDL